MVVDIIVKDLNEYIHHIQSKLSKENSFGDFNVRFVSENMAENLKRYWMDKGYQVTIHKCSSCKYWDILIRK